MTNYTFITRWRFESPLEHVWDEIAHPLEWPEWWRGVEKVVEIEPGDVDGVGSLRRYTWKSALPYRLEFDLRTTTVDRHVRIEGRATGELDGSGVWTFRRENGATLVQYDWKVSTTKRWMEVLAPVARPLFGWNHDVVMRWGEQGLALRLDNRGKDRRS